MRFIVIRMLCIFSFADLSLYKIWKFAVIHC